ncbi:MJ0042-type zinc finger domain-containing protein [Phreatobacter stygius]|uniref:DUF3426 domain-containing protein n=1 Tax=Phreatobacter stygius TaxID=1940610 RepID=A0A4D7AX89_9HYPH|nr:MJ0042-type zinc finger domain-containing protein [Phreatobacter stygius]QCI64701.1 DUF3426 domain-containing protein [Phreatobacter stygius]
MLIVCPSCATAFRVTATALGDAGRQVRCARCRTVWLATPDSALPEPAIAEAEAHSGSTANQAAGDDDWGAAFAEEARDRPGSEPVETSAAMPVAESPPIAPDMPADPLPPRVDDRQAASPVKPRSSRGDIESSAAQRRKRAYAARSKGFSLRLPVPMTIVLIGMAVLATFFLGREQVVRTVPDSATVYETLGVPVNLRGVDFQEVKGANEIVDGVVVLVVEGKLVNITGRPIDLPRLRLAVRDATGKEIYTWTATAPKPQLAPGEAAPFRSRLASPPPDGATVEVRFFTRQDAGGR